MTSPYVPGESMNAAKMYDRIESRLDGFDILVADTSWLPITNISSSYSGSVWQYRVKNNELRIRGSLTRSSGSVTAGETVSGLPAGTFPTGSSVYRIPFQSSTTVSGFLALSTAGILTVAQVSGTTSGITVATVPIPLD